VTPTTQLLSLGVNNHQTIWNEGSEDNVSWEIGHYLFLATKCNPTVLETFLAPDYTANAWGEEVRALFPSVWSSIGVASAFTGYAHNQRKKLLDDKDKRRNKYATAYVRTLYNAWELLSTGTFHVDVR
jgi:predicted nucleotidyltransferase